MRGKVMFSVSVCFHVQETSILGNAERWNYQPNFQEGVQNPLPGDKDGVMKEVLKHFPVLCFLLLCLLFCLCLGTSTARSFFSPTALWLGGLSGFFCINGPISISSNWDFILKEKDRDGFLLSRSWIQQQSPLLAVYPSHLLAVI